MRTILFTGKGGVGKTTVASATALRCAASGLRTAIVSTDPAHSLADSFDIELSGELTEVAPGCFAKQLDAADKMEEQWGEIRSYLGEVFNWAGLDEIEAEELSVLPGLEEIFALIDITTFHDDPAWDVLIVDCAPTAETIRLLSMPDVLSWYMDRVFPLGRSVTKLVGPVVSKLTQAPIAGDEVFGAAERMYTQLDRVREILRDGDQASVRLVMNPEKMVIAEARRTFTYLSLFGYSVDAVVMNRLIPADVVDPWFAQWKEAQATHLETVEEGFTPIPILTAELASNEVVGVDALVAFADALYGDVSPDDVMFEGDPLTIEREGDTFVMSFDLPFASKDDLEVGRGPDELYVRLGPYRRAIMLPNSLARREVSGASLDGARLSVRFVSKVPTEAGVGASGRNKREASVRR